MPEGDTVLRTARRLDRALRDRPLLAAELRWGDLGGIDLAGARTLEVAARGKHLLHRFDDGRTLHTHLRMEGSWRVAATGDPTGARRQRGFDVRAVLITQSWTCLGLRLGMLDLVPTSREHVLVGHLGPDVLGEDWDLDLAVDNLSRAEDAEIGAALLDQRHLAGIGTIYASETLFCERISPWSPIGSLSRETLARVVERARRLLLAGARRSSPCTTGFPRRGEALYVHGRSGRPCRHCGGSLRVAPIGRAPRDRLLFYCPRCQGGLAPTDQGGPVAPLGAPGRRRHGEGPGHPGSPGRSRREPGGADRGRRR